MSQIVRAHLDFVSVHCGGIGTGHYAGIVHEDVQFEVGIADAGREVTYRFIGGDVQNLNLNLIR